jgi:FkbM family methyltransferase
MEAVPHVANFCKSILSTNVLNAASRAVHCLRIYHRPFGIYGVLAISSYRLFGWPQELDARSAGIKNPVHLRVRTSDVSIYYDILLCEQYAINLPFTPKIIVDAGANIGMASIYYAHRYPDARIIAVEPEASNFGVLARNVKPDSNILPVNAALWNRDGEIAVSARGPTSSKLDFVVHQGQGAPVRALTMPTLMNDAQIQSIDILKVDIEGAEKEVFESADWMDSVRCLVIELHDRLRPGCSAAVGSVTRGFVTLQRGETTIYVRKSCIRPKG